MEGIRKFASVAFRILLSCVVIGILIENIILVRQNGLLKSGILIERVSAGQHLKNLSGIALDGRIQPIKLPTMTSQRLVIFTFTSGCEFCGEVQPVWAELAKDLRQGGISVLWVSGDPVDATKDYCERALIPLSDVVADPPNRTWLQLGLRAVPTTIVVGSGGVVERVWSGVITTSSLSQIRDYLQLKPR